jgi:Putative MetA-pathway of phenol degradation
MSEYYNIDNIAPSFVFVTSQQLSQSFTLITNLGGSWNGNDATSTGLYTINLSCAFTDTFGAFIENYGSVTKGTWDTRFDTGVAWLVTPNLQLDLLGGYGSNHGLQDYFISTGFSWRMNRQKTPP